MFKTSGVIENHTRAVTGLKYSIDGALLASCSADQTCKIFESNSGRKMLTLSGEHTEGLNDLVWINERGVATASDDCNIVVWETQRGESVHTLKGHQSVVYCLSCHPTEDIILSGSEDCTFRLWDVRAGRSACVLSIDAHSEPITSVNFHPSGMDIMTTSYDGVVRFWDVRNGACLRTVIHDRQSPIGFSRYSPNGLYVLTSALDNTIRLIRPFYGTTYSTDSSITSGNGCSTGGARRGAGSRATRTYRCVVGSVRELKRYTGHRSERYCSPVSFARLDPDRALASSTGDEMDGEDSEEQSQGADGEDVIISGSEDANVYIWNTISQRVEKTLTGHRGPILALDYNHNFQQLATGGGGGDFSIKLWDFCPHN